MLAHDFSRTACAHGFQDIKHDTSNKGLIHKNPDLSGDQYFHFVKPSLKNQLGLLGLDVIYSRGLADRLYYKDHNGEEVEVLDLVGGFGACLLGHNHPDIVSIISEKIRYAQPNLVQGSVQAESGRLGARLSNQLSRLTGKTYVCIFGNSGAEAVDIAIKHSELERAEKIQTFRKAMHHDFSVNKNKRQEGPYRLEPETLQHSGLIENGLIPESFEECLSLIECHNQKVFNRPPLYLALKGAFHGKSIGSLSLTYNANYRRPFAALLEKTHFLDPCVTERLEAIFEESLQHYYILSRDEDFRIHIKKKPISNIAALFVEPIQGEGGILPIGYDFLKECRRLCDNYQVPLIFDEIQSGLGRTGRFFASEHVGVPGDIYLLSKSLGGGIAKISATLIDRDHYVDEFSLIHSSTFAEDPLSSAIGNKVLDILERDQILKMAEEKGSYLKRHLEKLTARYPEVVDSVRGKGLMLGIAFSHQKNSNSSVIREIDKAHRLSHFISGYLFHQDNIRILPTLSESRVLRLEPSVYISYRDLDRVVHAFERLCKVLTKNNAHELLGFMTTKRTIADYSAKTYSKKRKMGRANTSVTKVGFLVHYIHPSQLKAIDPSFRTLSSVGQERFIRNMMCIAKPMHISSTDITSASGKKINFNLILVPITSQHMVEFLKNPGASPALNMVEDAVQAAHEMGCQAVGLGQYTSIISKNGLLIRQPQLTLTTGNSNTVAVSVRAILKAIWMKDLDPSCINLSLVGAAGNIGASYAGMISNYFSKINLVGSSKSGSLKRLESIRYKIIVNAYRMLVKNHYSSDRKKGITQQLFESPLIKRLIHENADPQTAWHAICSEGLADEIISVSTDIKSICRSNVIVAVSNSSEKIIRNELVPRNAIICDVSVPCTTEADVIQNRGDVLFFTGGIVKLPNGEAIQAPAYPLPKGHVFACMAETMLLGLSGIRENLSYGDLKMRNIQLIENLSRYHGFELGPLKTISTL